MLLGMAAPCIFRLMLEAFQLGTTFNGTITYNVSDTNGFNEITMSGTELYDTGINDTTKTINITQVKKADGTDITSSCSISNNLLSTPNSTPLKENLTINFIVTKAIDMLYLAGIHHN